MRPTPSRSPPRPAPPVPPSPWRANASVTTTIIDNDTTTWSITGETSVTEDPAVNNTASYTVNLGGTLQSGENASIVLSLTNNTTNRTGLDLATEAQFDTAVQTAVLTYNARLRPGLAEL